jgi:hypothetical protein
MCCSLGGCASLSRETIVEETLWQSENVIDFMQTTQISRQPQYFREIGTMSPFTGPHPNETQVVLFSVLFGGLHFAATELLDIETHNDGPWADRVWELGSLVWKGNVVLHNHRIGLGFTTHF